MTPITVEEARAVLAARGHGNGAEAGNGERGHAISLASAFDPAGDARPGDAVPVYVPQEDGSLAVRLLAWGFPRDGRPNAVFNTRIETALSQLGLDGRGMWANAIARGRCLVPVRAFYESHGSERVPSLTTGKPVRRQYRFRLPGARAFLLAGVQEDGWFSIVTTAPNESVSPVHDRMPLVLGPGESSVWLGPDFATLANRPCPPLSAEPER